jgi:RNA polymerase sigma-70 factor, ECF subfamily
VVHALLERRRLEQHRLEQHRLERAGSRRMRREPLRGAPAGADGSARELALVDAARAGDREAFARLYETHAPRLHGLLLAHARPGEVRDLLHDVFLSALRNLASLDDPRRFGAWLGTIARNLARDDHKRRRPETELEDGEEIASRDTGADGGGGDSEESERVLAALRELPETYREALTLRLVEGWTGPQIAERTGMTAGSVRVHLCRGMKLLRESLERSGRAR